MIWEEQETKAEARHKRAEIAMQVVREFVYSSSARQYANPGVEIIRCQDDAPDKSINVKRNRLAHIALDYLTNYLKD